MASKPESPTEPFKRALAHAARSLAETPDLEVVFSGEGPSLIGNRAVLPHPPRDLNPKEAARIRGLADQMALRLAHHNAAAHARARPSSPDGQAAFEAIEQARLEAIGANALGGVRAEPDRRARGPPRKAGPDPRRRHRPPVGPDGRDPVADGPRAPDRRRPARRRQGPGRHPARRHREPGRQGPGPPGRRHRRPGRLRPVTREILRDLDLGEDMSDATEQSDEDEGDEDQNTEASEDDSGEGEGEQSDGAEPEQAESSDRESEAGDEEMVQSEQDGDPRTPRKRRRWATAPSRPVPIPARARPTSRPTRCSPPPMTRSSRPRTCATPTS
jgi:cobaltochelatase CobT